jgi:hypothetical protein
MKAYMLLGLVAATAAPFACSSSRSETPDTALASGGTGEGGALGEGGTLEGSGGDARIDAAGGGATGGSPGSGGRVGTGGTTSGGIDGGATAGNLCEGLVQDKEKHPMTALAKPAVGAFATDAEFGTKIYRVSEVKASGSSDAVIKPMYSTVAAWNADESMLLLYSVAAGHQLYHGKTYAFLRSLDISPADLEQVYWDTTDPDILYYVDGKKFIRYHVGRSQAETQTTFTFCTDSASGGSDPMFTSFDSARIGLGCGDQAFIYDIKANTVVARKTNTDDNPAQIAPSGTLAYFSDSGRVADEGLNVLRTLDLAEPWGHASMGRLPTGEDTWNGAVYDDGPKGNSDIGSVVTFDLTTGKSRVIIGPKTGYPYPPTTHISALAYRQPGWVVASTVGETSGAGLLDLEVLVANTVTGTVCRAGRHRSWGKENTKLQESYWAEAHAVPSPSGTRIAFGSDWGNGTTVDTYVIELPSYVR